MNAYCDLNKITSFCLKKPLIFQLRRLWLFEVRNISGHSLDCLLNELNSPIISYRPGNYKATMTETLQLLHSNFRNDRSPGQLDCPPTDHHVIIISPRRGRVGMLVNFSKLLLQIPLNDTAKSIIQNKHDTSKRIAFEEIYPSQASPFHSLNTARCFLVWKGITMHPLPWTPHNFSRNSRKTPGRYYPEFQWFSRSRLWRSSLRERENIWDPG